MPTNEIQQEQPKKRENIGGGGLGRKKDQGGWEKRNGAERRKRKEGQGSSLGAKCSPPARAEVIDRPHRVGLERGRGSPCRDANHRSSQRAHLVQEALQQLAGLGHLRLSSGRWEGGKVGRGEEGWIMGMIKHVCTQSGRSVDRNGRHAGKRRVAKAGVVYIPCSLNALGQPPDSSPLVGQRHRSTRSCGGFTRRSEMFPTGKCG